MKNDVKNDMKKPSWYTDEYDNSWGKVRTAFSRDWEQTKHDFGSKTARDLNQDVNDTVRQATTGDFATHEPAFRFGYAAQRSFRSQHPTWNNDLETKLKQDYGTDYDRDRDYIRRAYEYKYDRAGDAGPQNENRV